MPRRRRVREEDPVEAVEEVEVAPELEKPTPASKPKPTGHGPKTVVLVSVNASQAVYVDGVKVSGSQRLNHVEDVSNYLKPGDLLTFQHWRCAGVQRFEVQVRERGFPKTLDELPDVPDASVHPKA